MLPTFLTSAIEKLVGEINENVELKKKVEVQKKQVELLNQKLKTENPLSIYFKNKLKIKRLMKHLKRKRMKFYYNKKRLLNYF
ncbi:hypothetical protein ABK040_007335 [Willaertia magna]